MTAGRRLVLLRHAKAETPGAFADVLRPLALAGRRQCAEVGAGLAAAGLGPGRVLVSAAVRTRQTWELVRGSMGDGITPQVDVLDGLYHAGVGDVLTLLRAVDDDVATVLVVGHEPTMSAAAGAFGDASGPEGLLDQVHRGLPTAGYAVLAIESWSGLERGGARLVDVVRPVGHTG